MLTHFPGSDSDYVGKSCGRHPDHHRRARRNHPQEPDMRRRAVLHLARRYGYFVVLLRRARFAIHSGTFNRINVRVFASGRAEILIPSVGPQKVVLSAFPIRSFRPAVRVAP